MATTTLRLQIRFAWWLQPYFYLLAVLCALTGMEPNEDRVNYWIERAMKVSVVKADD